jgi:phospholipid transport system substrate-binding protein
MGANRGLAFHRTMSVTARGLAALAAACLLTAASAQESPDVLVKGAVAEVTRAINADPGLQSGDRTRIAALVEDKIVPRLGIERMTQSAVGRHWGATTPAQRQDLAREFKSLLINTYAGALSSYRPDTVIEYRPFRLAAGDTDAVVRSLVRTSGGAEPIQIDYFLEQVDGAWKVTDLNVLGARLVETYRTQFNGVISASGVDGLIRALGAKNRANAAQPRS